MSDITYLIKVANRYSRTTSRTLEKDAAIWPALQKAWSLGQRARKMGVRGWKSYKSTRDAENFTRNNDLKSSQDALESAVSLGTSFGGMPLQIAGATGTELGLLGDKYRQKGQSQAAEEQAILNHPMAQYLNSKNPVLKLMAYKVLVEQQMRRNAVGIGRGAAQSLAEHLHKTPEELTAADYLRLPETVGYDLAENVTERWAPRVQQGVEIAQDAWDKAKPYVDQGLEYAKQTGQTVANTAKEVGSAVRDGAQKAWNTGTQAAQAAWDKSTQAAQSAWNKSTAAAQSAVNKGSEMAQKAWDKGTQAAQSAWNTGKDAVQAGAGAVANGAKSAWQGAKNTGKSVGRYFGWK